MSQFRMMLSHIVSLGSPLFGSESILCLWVTYIFTFKGAFVNDSPCFIFNLTQLLVPYFPQNIRSENILKGNNIEVDYKYFIGSFFLIMSRSDFDKCRKIHATRLRYGF